MYLPTKSFESPVSSMSEDLLDRWRLAKDVYTIVRETPRDWSCRIGIYGKWGEGKTSLLRFVETQAHSDGLVSFWVNPSQAENADGLWQVVLEAFIDALDREGILIEEVRAWRVKFLAQKTDPLDKLAELNPYAKALAGFGRAAIKEWLRPDGEQIRKLREKLHANKVVVFIDDLDRTHPTLVPTLLLGLRDLLDLPGFCFVVAFDDEVVSKTLASVNSAWGDGKAFLDKVLDFSFSLPKPKTDQRLDLVKYHIRQLCPWMNLDVVEQNSDLLPETPRKLKALLRNLMTLGPQMRRHDPAEIQWIDFFMGQLVRLESPGFLDDFLRDDNESLVQVGAYLPQKQGQSSFDERLEMAIKDSGAIDAALLPRLTKLLKLWSERRVFVGGKNLGYYAGFGSIHRDITQREFKEVIRGYRESRDRGALEAQLVEHAALVASPATDVAQEFLRIVLEARGEYLENAADTEMESDTIEFLARAHECLELIGSVLERPTSLFALTPAFGSTLVRSIAGQSFRWIHFDVSVYQQTRQEERQLLLVLARKDLVGGLDWLDFLLPWTDETLYFSGAGHTAAAQLIDELLRTVQDRVTSEALELFTREGAHLQFYAAKATRATRFCFFDINSPLWQDAGRIQFFGVLENANRSRAVRQNASELLGCLSWTTAHSGFAGNPDELKRILLLPGVAKALWAASTAQRIHYRFQQRLIEIRRAILKVGIDEDQLPVPQWLAGRVKELGGSPSDPGSAKADAAT
jgi:hypothetical protein